MRNNLKALVLVWMLGWGLRARAEELVALHSLITVLVYNSTEAPGALIREAEVDAGRVFDGAGIAVNWINCGRTADPFAESPCSKQVGPEDVVVRIVPKAQTLPRWVCGVSFLANGTGAYADVFLDHVIELRQEHQDIALAPILGHVVAHEVGHLLLGTTAHSSTGLMQGNWDTAELKKISRGGLRFTPDQAEQIRARVAVRRESPSAAPVVAALRR